MLGDDVEAPLSETPEPATAVPDVGSPDALPPVAVKVLFPEHARQRPDGVSRLGTDRSSGRAHAFATELSGHGQRIEKISTIGYAGGVAACLAARAFSKDSPAVALGVGGVGAVLLAAGRSAEPDAPQTGRILKSVGTGLTVTTAMVWAAQSIVRVLERHKRSGNGDSDG